RFDAPTSIARPRRASGGTSTTPRWRASSTSLAPRVLVAARACYVDRPSMPNRRWSALAVVALASITAAGCKPEEERTVELVEEMAALFSRHQADCDRLGAEFDTFATANAARFAD